MESQQKDEKEISLLDLFYQAEKIVMTLIKSLAKILIKILQFIYVQKVTIGCCLLLAILTGGLLYKIKNRTYQASITASIYGVSPSLIKSTLSSVGLDPKNSNKLTTNTFPYVYQIDCFYYIDNQNDNFPDYIDFSDILSSTLDSTKRIMNDRLFIQIYFSDTTQMETLKNNILQFLNTDYQINSTFKKRNQTLLDEIEICNREINRIDSMASITYFDKSNNAKLKNENNKIQLENSDKQLFYNDLLYLNAKKGNTLTLLNEKPVEFFSNFAIQEPPSSTLKHFICTSALYGFVISLLISLGIHFRKNLLLLLKNEMPSNQSQKE